MLLVIYLFFLMITFILYRVLRTLYVCLDLIAFTTVSPSLCMAPGGSISSDFIKKNNKLHCTTFKYHIRGSHLLLKEDRAESLSVCYSFWTNVLEIDPPGAICSLGKKVNKSIFSVFCLFLTKMHEINAPADSADLVKSKQKKRMKVWILETRK